MANNHQIQQVLVRVCVPPRQAAARVFPWMDFAMRTGTPLALPDFFQQMDSAFSDPLKVQKAIAKLNGQDGKLDFSQKKMSFRAFHYEFEQALLEANGWEWDDAVKKGYLKRGLSRELQLALVSQPEPATYIEFVNQLRGTADRLEAISKASQPPQQQQRSMMDWEPTPPNSKARGDVVTKEIQRRREKDQCIKCGRLGHFARECRTGWRLDIAPRFPGNDKPTTKKKKVQKASV